MRRYFFILIMVVLPLSCFTQNNFQDLIIGNWVLDKEENDAGFSLELDSDIVIEPPRSNDKPKVAEKINRSKQMYLFYEDNMVDIFIAPEEGFKRPYEIKDSILFLGGVEYMIQELSSEKMILKTILDSTTMIILGETTLFFSRTEEQRKKVPLTETITSYYENGQLEMQGLKEMGHPTGIWKEWYENGQVKSVIYYMNLFPIMQIHFDEQGNVKSQSWMDAAMNFRED